MPLLNLKPEQRTVRRYYESLAEFDALGVGHETAVRSAFQSLLDDTARQFAWKLVPEYPIRRPGRKAASVDAALVDVFNLPHGYWEAKDLADKLDREIKKKFEAGYPRDNILFQTPRRAVLYQSDSAPVLDEDITRPEALVDVLKTFLEYQPPAIADWEKASVEFKDKVPEIAGALVTAIRKEHKANAAFRTAFADFVRVAQASLNPNLAEAAVEEMLVQHILTERIFRKIFDAGDFMQRNVVAVEIEKVVGALTGRYFSRDKFLASLDRFYVAIENAAGTIKDFAAKQTFLNTVYERLNFQGFSVKVADGQRDRVHAAGHRGFHDRERGHAAAAGVRASAGAGDAGRTYPRPFRGYRQLHRQPDGQAVPTALPASTRAAAKQQVLLLP